MAERASVFDAVNIGLEGTPGTEVDGNRRLEAYSIDPKWEGGVEAFRPDGSKFPTLVTVGKEHTTAAVDGILDYANVVYPLASLIQYGTANIAAVGTTGAYTWTFAPDTDGPDTCATYTVEKGSSVRAEQFEYGKFTGFGFSFNAGDSQIAVTGEMIGAQFRSGITMCGTASTVEAVPCHPKHCTLAIDATQAALGTSAALSRVLALEWNYTGKDGPLFTVGTTNSWDALVEQAAELGGSFTLEADATGMGYLTSVQAGTLKWMQIKFAGAAIGTSAYNITIQMPVHLTAYPELSDMDGVVASKYAYTAVHDGTWGKALSVSVTNALSGL